MITAEGFRLGVGIVLVNHQEQVFWAKRVGQNAWQFPQGGLQNKEFAEQALWRELKEEIGLEKYQVRLLGKTKNWLYYKIPDKLQREREGERMCVGQKQIWYLLKLKAPDTAINLLSQDYKPEFDDWAWVSYWYPLHQVVSFKRELYRRALTQLRTFLNPNPFVQPYATYNINISHLDYFI
ncbi:MAG: RNA pyrophosphohydrolase [Gammaproteobacteria bacterium]